MLSFADMMHFFAHEFSSLGGRRLSFPRILASPLNGLLFWHKHSPSG